MKILSVTPNSLTYSHEFWDGEKRRYDTLKFTVDRRAMGNKMSGEFMRRHGLEKYAIKP